MNHCSLEMDIEFMVAVLCTAILANINVKVLGGLLPTGMVRI